MNDLMDDMTRAQCFVLYHSIQLRRMNTSSPRLNTDACKDLPTKNSRDR